MKSRNRIIYQLIVNGSKKREVASSFKISVQRVYNIYIREKERESFSPSRKMFSIRAQNALLSFFNGDESIFDDPERIGSLPYSKLLMIKNIGKNTADEIINICKQMKSR